MIGIEFVQDKATKSPFPKEADVTNEIIELGMRNGILLYPAAAGLDGVTGAAIIISPPLTISEEECAELLMRIDITFQQFNESEGKRPSQQGSES